MRRKNAPYQIFAVVFSTLAAVLCISCRCDLPEDEEDKAVKKKYEAEKSRNARVLILDK